MIDKPLFIARRQQFLQKIGPDGVAIIAAAPECIRNGDAHYRYRQHSDFYYLTGFLEPQAVLVLAPGHAEGDILFFNRERDALAEQWVGARAGQEGACRDYGFDKAYPIDAFREKLPSLLTNRNTLFYHMGRDAAFDDMIMHTLEAVRQKVRSGIQAPQRVVDLESTLHEMRLYKSKEELDVMQHAVDISVAAHKRAMRACRSGLYEYQVEAELIHEFYRQGCQSVAYDSIVAGGKNACTLHYIDNKDKLNDDDLLLIDAGCEYQYYAADITRTFPINGRFTPPQKAVYNVVLEAQLAGIATIKPGVSWDAPQQAIVRVLTQGLIDLGVLKGELDRLIAEEAYRPYYMHRSGHWLGLDVHDVGAYKVQEEWRPFEEGMVLTVEPGLYLRDLGIGIRIEDDVCVTADGCRVLSAALPKTVDDIEALMAES